MSKLIKPGLSISILKDAIDSYIHSNMVHVNYAVYKELKHRGDTVSMLSQIKPYYFRSKQQYCTRNMTYLRFLTVLRQLCKYFNLVFSNKIIYYKGNYEPTIIIYIEKGLSTADVLESPKT